MVTSILEGSTITALKQPRSPLRRWCRRASDYLAKMAFAHQVGHQAICDMQDKCHDPFPATSSLCKS